MNKPVCKPWHQVMTLREDVKSGELSLSLFAADLYDVARGTGPEIYRDPKAFFETTYATLNLRKLAKDVMLRLNGDSPRAVRQLAQTYGGGKTHALITLFHLACAPETRLVGQSVEQIKQFSGLVSFPKARVVVLPFDKIDTERGMETPSGVADEAPLWLRHPWSILAYQLRGLEGLRSLHATGEAAERESAPTENLLTPLLTTQSGEAAGTLILIDEVLMYARAMLDIKPEWGIQLINFFQALTQATVKVPRCALVASLLANDPARNDPKGRQYAQEVAEVFKRDEEENITPVEKDDVAELLRRRFFEEGTPASARKTNAIAALDGIKAWDEQTKSEGAAAEDRYTNSFPFHPDLMDVFYVKWTNIATFQRTRGVLRLFALALRDAATWGDASPLVGANVFLNAPDTASPSPSARVLTEVATSAIVRGIPANWDAILEKEMAWAQDIQAQQGLKSGREVEQAVMAVFLHSQPEGQKASLRDLLVLITATRPDKVDLRKALRRWTELSWFLDEREIATAKTVEGGDKGLPESWRLGLQANLNQLFAQKREAILPETVDQQLSEDLKKENKYLTAGASATGAQAHKLPLKGVADVGDDGQFHFVILGPSAASERAKPNKEAVRYLNEKTGGAPRVHKNMVVVAVPSAEKWGIVQDQMRSLKAWQQVSSAAPELKLNYEQTKMLDDSLKKAETLAAESLLKTYTVAIAYTKSGDPEAVTVADNGTTLFASVRANKALNIMDTIIAPDTLLDEENSYYAWQKGAQARPVKHILDAFTQQPKMPKMLNPNAIQDTILAGCEEGIYALRWKYPDGTTETIWRGRPDDGVLADPSLEAVLPAAAVLTQLSPALLKPGALGNLWPETGRVTMADLRHYFRGGHEAKGQEKDGYTPTVMIPAVDPSVLEKAVCEAVKLGYIGLISGNAAYFEEDVPPGELTDASMLTAKPNSLPADALLPSSLAAGWNGQSETTAAALWNALIAQQGEPVAWSVFRRGMIAATSSRSLQTTPSSQPVENSQASQAPQIRLTPVNAPGEKPPSPVPMFPSQHVATAPVSVDQLQDLADRVSELTAAAAGYGLTFQITVELGVDAVPGEDVLAKINAILSDIVPDFSL